MMDTKFLRICVAAALVTMAGCVPSHTNTYQYTVDQQPPEPTWMNAELTEQQEEVGKTSVRNLLKDPDSATFSELYGARRIDGEGPVAVCGYVNAKNSYGGYVGKKRFFAFEKNAAIWSDQPQYGYSAENDMLKDICLIR